LNKRKTGPNLIFMDDTATIPSNLTRRHILFLGNIVFLNHDPIHPRKTPPPHTPYPDVPLCSLLASAFDSWRISLHKCEPLKFCFSTGQPFFSFYHAIHKSGSDQTMSFAIASPKHRKFQTCKRHLIAYPNGVRCYVESP